MNVENVIKVCPLTGGITATVVDATRHYFGGYYHVQLLVKAAIPVNVDTCATLADYEDALVRLGHVVTFSRTLEKMAVIEAEIEGVRQQLLSAFETNLLPYLLRDDFVPGFVRSEYRKKLKSVPQFSGNYA